MTAKKKDIGRVGADGARRAVEEMRTWPLEQAKTRFSEVIRLAGTEGPQLVTVHGREAAVVIAAEDYRALGSPARNDVPLVVFLQGLGLANQSVHRGGSTERELEL